MDYEVLKSKVSLITRQGRVPRTSVRGYQLKGGNWYDANYDA